MLNFRYIFLILTVLIDSTFWAQVGPANYRSFQKNNLFGFCDDQNRVMIEPQYQYAFDFVNGIATVKKGAFFGYINTKNEAITAFEFEKCGDFIGEFAMVQKNGKIGYLNRSGEVVVPSEFETVGFIGDSYFVCKLNGKVALHGRNKRLTDFDFDEIGSLASGFFYWKKGDSYGVLSAEGKQVGNIQFIDKPYLYRKIVAKDTIEYILGEEKNANNLTYMDLRGSVLIDGAKYQTISGVGLPFILCKVDTLHTVVNLLTGEIVVEPTATSHYEADWLECGGRRRITNHFVLFGSRENLELHSLEHPSFVLKELTRKPWFTEELVVTHNANETANVYRHNGKQIIKEAKVDYYGYSSSLLTSSICPTESLDLTILKAGKVATGNLLSGKIKFKTKGDLSKTRAYFGIKDTYSKVFSGFKRSYMSEKIVVYTLFENELSYFFVFAEGEPPHYLFKLETEVPLKIKQVTFDKVMGEYTLITTTNGKEETRDFSIYE